MTDPKIGDKIKILEGILEGAYGYVSAVNRKHGTITVMIPGNQIHPADRKKFVVKHTRHGIFVPLQLLEGEWEPYDRKIILLP